MLHGWKDSLSTFDGLIQSLPGYRIVRLDMPGFGKSGTPPTAWGVGEYVQFVAEFIQKMNLSVDVLVGHSFGGRVAIKGVGCGALKPKKLILIAAAGLARKNTVMNYMLAGFAKAGRIATSIPPLSFWQSTLRRKLYGAIGSDYFNAGSLKETFKKVVSEDLSEYAEKITIPTLLIWGRQDRATPLSQAERIHRLIEASQLEILMDAGHFVHKEKPKEVATLIQSFL
jgi:pimeloyl-ACP methyl ester carboxylesterase